MWSDVGLSSLFPTAHTVPLRMLTTFPFIHSSIHSFFVCFVGLSKTLLDKIKKCFEENRVRLKSIYSSSLIASGKSGNLSCVLSYWEIFFNDENRRRLFLPVIGLSKRRFIYWSLSSISATVHTVPLRMLATFPFIHPSIHSFFCLFPSFLNENLIRKSNQFPHCPIFSLMTSNTCYI